MKSAKFGALCVGVLVAGAGSVLGLLLAPTAAQASYSEINPCIMYNWEEVEFNADRDQISPCSPGTAGLFPIMNMNIVVPMLNQLNSHFGTYNVGGPVSAYRNERMGGGAAGAAEFARAVNGDPQSAVFGGPGMAAGYTPTETTGQWIDRHLQPLRDHHVNSWFNTTWSNPDDDHQITRYDSDIWTVTLGADLPMFSDDILVGAFTSYTHSEVNTTFNNADTHSQLGTFGPYFVYTMNDNVAFDFTVAGVFGEHENRVGVPGGPGGSPKARGNQDTRGYFVSMNVNGNYWIGNYGVQGRLGFMHSYMSTDRYALRSGGAAVGIAGTDNDLSQIQMAAQFNYFYDKGLPFCEKVMAMPFVRITANFDVQYDRIMVAPGFNNHPNDREEAVIGWGVSLFGDGPFSGSVETGYTAGRSEFESWNVSGTLNYAF